MTKEQILIADYLKNMLTQKRVWTYKPGGRKEWCWNECVNDKAMYFGFNQAMEKIWNGHDFTVETIRNICRRKPHAKFAHIVIKFVKEISKGDIIIAVKGNLEVVGTGIVKDKSDQFQFNGNRKWFLSWRKVDWIDFGPRSFDIGQLELSKNIAQDTVNEIREAQDKRKLLRHLIKEDFCTAPDHEITDNADMTGRGQGFISDSRAKKEIEKLAMDKAIIYLRRNKYVNIEDVSDANCYDYKCEKKNKRYRVEVKGTTTNGKSVLLTRSEVKSASQARTILYILHSVSVKKKGKTYKAFGGQENILNPFRIIEANLEATAYSYKID